MNSLRNEMWIVCFTNQEEAQAIVDTPSSLGYTETSALKAQKLAIKPLKINGVKPTTDNIKNGSYQLTVDLCFIYKELL